MTDIPGAWFKAPKQACTPSPLCVDHSHPAISITYTLKSSLILLCASVSLQHRTRKATAMGALDRRSAHEHMMLTGSHCASVKPGGDTGKVNNGRPQPKTQLKSYFATLRGRLPAALGASKRRHRHGLAHPELLHLEGGPA